MERWRGGGWREEGWEGGEVGGCRVQGAGCRVDEMNCSPRSRLGGNFQGRPAVGRRKEQRGGGSGEEGDEKTGKVREKRERLTGERRRSGGRGAAGRERRAPGLEEERRRGDGGSQGRRGGAGPRPPPSLAPGALTWALPPPRGPSREEGSRLRPGSPPDAVPRHRLSSASERRCSLGLRGQETPRAAESSPGPRRPAPRPRSRPRSRSHAHRC